MGTRTVRGAGRAVALAVVTLALAACGGTSPQEAASDDDLAGRAFVSTRVTGRDLVEGTEVRLIFQEGRVSVTAGCNTLNGEAAWEDGRLVVQGPMAQTMMACDPALSEQDVWLAALLTSEPPLTLDGSTLTLGEASESSVGIMFAEQ